MYLFVSSDDCKDLYPANTPINFTVELPQPVEGTHISLHHVYYTKRPQATKEYYYVLCDLVEPSVLAGKEKRVLGSFFEKGSLEHPQDIALISSFVKRINIKIVTNDINIPGDLVSVYLTLKIN